MRKRNYQLQTARPKGMEWTARGKTHNALRDLRPTASVSIRHIYLHLWDRDYHGFGYEDNGGHTAAVHGVGNNFLDLLIYKHIYTYTWLKLIIYINGVHSRLLVMIL